MIEREQREKVREKGLSEYQMKSKLKSEWDQGDVYKVDKQ